MTVSRTLRFLVALLVVAGTGCAWSNRPLRPTAAPEAGGSCGDDRALTLTYYGSAGFVVRYGAHAFLTGGMVSNPGLWTTYVRRTSPDPAQISRFFDAIDMRGVEMALIGHSHHDHLMDVPAIVKRYAPGAVIVGSATTRNLLTPDASLNVLALGGDTVATRDRPGIPLTFPATGMPRFRVVALSWAHAPNIEGWTFAAGHQRKPLASLPAHARAWRMGSVFAYIIDVLREDGTAAFRIHFSDAAARRGQSPTGALPDDGATRVAIVSGGNFDWGPDYPRSLLRWFNPHATVLGHWENFFSRHAPPPGKTPGAIPGLPTTLLRHLMRAGVPAGAPWVTPVPGATVRVCERAP
jgi:hypothetical protein